LGNESFCFPIGIGKVGASLVMKSPRIHLITVGNLIVDEEYTSIKGEAVA